MFISDSKRRHWLQLALALFSASVLNRATPISLLTSNKRIGRINNLGIFLVVGKIINCHFRLNNDMLKNFFRQSLFRNYAKLIFSSIIDLRNSSDTWMLEFVRL